MKFKPLGAIVIAAAVAFVGVGYTMGVGPFEPELQAVTTVTSTRAAAAFRALNEFI